MSGAVTLEIDLHVHSEASYDGHEPVDLLLEHAADIDLDAIVITDHDVVHASVEAAKRAEEYGLIGIAGVEISTAHGHLLGIGIDELPAVGQPIGKTIEDVHDLGGVAVVPHPFQRTRHGIRKRNLRRIDPDAIETYNSWLFTGYRNRRARQYARRHGYPGVGGSDAHSLLTVGRAFTRVRIGEDVAEITSGDVVEAIRTGATGIVGHRASLSRASGHYTKAAGRKTAWGARRIASTAAGPVPFL